MNAFYVWGAVVLLAISALITRCSFFLFGHAVKLPAKVRHALGYAPAVAMAAIVVPDLMMMGGEVNIHWSNPKLLAGIGAALFFLVTRHLLGTLVIGMVLFTALRLML